MRFVLRRVPSADMLDMLRTAERSAAALCAFALATSIEPAHLHAERIAIAETAAHAAPRSEAEHADPDRTRAPPNARRTQIAVPENNPLELYPPRAGSTFAPLTIALHGKDMDPIELCDGFRDEERARSWLVCPAGNAPRGDAFDWGGPTEDRIAAIDAQLAAVDEVYGPLVDHARGDVLVGFSRGGFLARDLVYARPGRFRGVVFLGAAVRLDPARIGQAGVRRVVLAAGDNDDARSTMQHTAVRLAANGIAARFVGLGPVGHVLPHDLGRIMREALAWVQDEDG